MIFSFSGKVRSVVIIAVAASALCGSSLTHAAGPPVRFLNIVVFGNSVQLTFSSQAGLNYVIEGSQDLKGWQPLQTLTATGASTQFNEAVGQNAYQFYRVRFAQ